jgi:uncharacterized protein YjbI with pentapeptide repeats
MDIKNRYTREIILTLASLTDADLTDADLTGAIHRIQSNDLPKL